MLRALFWGTLTCALSAQVPAPAPLSFDALLAKAKADPHLLRLEADLASRQRLLASTGGFLKEGPTVLAEAGRRSGPVTATTDKVAQVDVPLLLAPGTRAKARQSLDQAEGTLLPLAWAEARHRLQLAYLDAWLAQARLDLRQSQVSLTEHWVRIAQARVAAGSDPAFQVDLVEGDLWRLRADLADTQRQVGESWAALRALADLPSTPLPLQEPGPVRLPAQAGLAAAFERSLLRRAQAERLAADQAQLNLQQTLRDSRWSLRGSYAAEGEERITRLGVGFRLPRLGELSAQRRETSTLRAALTRDAEAVSYQLEARFQTALLRLQTLGELPVPHRFAPALKAVDLRLQEGKERPSEALQLRRQLLEAETAGLQQLHQAHALAAELHLLTLGDAR